MQILVVLFRQKAHFQKKTIKDKTSLISMPEKKRLFLQNITKHKLLEKYRKLRK